MDRADFELFNNAPQPAALVIVDDDGAPVDMTGQTFKLQVKARDAAGKPTGSVLLTLTTGSGIEGDVAAGEFEPTFPKQSAGGLAPGAYIYDCLVLEMGAAVDTLTWGHIDVREGIAT